MSPWIRMGRDNLIALIFPETYFHYDFGEISDAPQTWRRKFLKGSNYHLAHWMGDGFISASNLASNFLSVRWLKGLLMKWLKPALVAL